MAVTASGLFIPTWRDILDASELAINLDVDTHRGALFTNSITPNFSSDTAYAVAPYNANENTGAGYTAGGALLVGTTFTESPSGSLMWDATDLSWAASTISAARCLFIYADAAAGNNGLMLINFGADYSTVAGTFQVAFAVTGLFAQDLTP